MLEEITTGTWQPSILPVGLVRQHQNSEEEEKSVNQGNGRERERKVTIYNNQQSPLVRLKQNKNDNCCIA